MAPRASGTLSDGTLLAILAGHTDRIVSAMFSSDGSRIVTASADHTARIWDADGGTVLATLSGPAGEVAAAAFSPDGTQVVAASLDHSAYVWQLDPLILMPAERRRAYVCRERLIGALSFSDREMQDPLLRGREELRNPCDRLGPLSASHYRHGFGRSHRGHPRRLLAVSGSGRRKGRLPLFPGRIWVWTSRRVLRYISLYIAK